MFLHGLPKAILRILKITALVMQQAFAKLMRKQFHWSLSQVHTTLLPIAAARRIAKLGAPSSDAAAPSVHDERCRDRSP